MHRLALPLRVRSAAGLRRAHLAISLLVFVVLGFHVGVWAVLLPDLAAALDLSPGRLGAALAAAAVAGIVSLFAGGPAVDRLGRRSITVVGLAGTGVAFAALSTVTSLGPLVVVLLAYGLFVSLVDIGANTIGGDYERRYDALAMTGLHAGFSAGAALGAMLAAGLIAADTSYRTIYGGLAAVLVAAAAATVLLPLPARAAAAPAPNASPLPTARLWAVPGVMFAIVLITVAFFGDSALESFLGLYLRDSLSSGVLLAGIGIGGFHLVSLAGALLSVLAQRRWGEGPVVVAAGLTSSAGVVIAVATERPVVAIGGLCLVGFALAPVVPTALSVAGRAAPDRSGRAVSLVTAAGYTSFITSPVLLGAIADATSLRTAIGTLVLTSLGVAALGLVLQRLLSSVRTRHGQPGLCE